MTNGKYRECETHSKKYQPHAKQIQRRQNPMKTETAEAQASELDNKFKSLLQLLTSEQKDDLYKLLLIMNQRRAA